VLIPVGGRRAALESISDLRLRQAQASRLRVLLPAPDPRASSVLARAGLVHEAEGESALLVDAVNGNSVAALETLRAAGVAVRSFELVRPTLEDLFLEAVAGESSHA